MPTGEPLHIVLFAYNFPPSASTGIHRPLRFWKYLPDNGVVPHVVCASEFGRVEMNNVHHAPRDPSWKARVVEGAARIVQRMVPHNERLPWAPHAVAAAGEIVEKHPVRALLSTFPPLSNHLAAQWLARRRGLAWAADFRDPLVGNAFRGRRGLRHEPWAERRIFRDARLLIAVTDGIVDAWKGKYPEYASKMHVLWNGYDPEENIPVRPVEARARRLLTYTGTIYGRRHPHLLLESIERLTGSGRLDPASLCIRVFGPISEDPAVRPLASFERLRALGCLETPGVVPHREALERLAESDYLLLLDTNEMNSGYGAPGKMFHYLRAGRSILAVIPPDSIVERIIRGSEVPAAFLYPEDSADAFDGKLLDFLRTPPAEARPNAWFLDNFDGRRQAATLAGLLRGMVAS